MKVNCSILFLCVFVTAAFAGVIPDVHSENILTGPELHLGYSSNIAASNPMDCFMYFVPLTSPTPVDITMVPGTTFRVRISSWKTSRRGNSIDVICDFEVTGQGTYKASYIPDDLIQYRLEEEKNPNELTKMLEWICVDGPCLGRIEGSGKIVKGEIVINSVEISFNRDKSKSPVRICMYDIPAVKGEFHYKNRKNCQVARINSLTFNRNDNGSPKMAVEIDMIKKKKEKEGLFSHLTAFIANVLSTSAPIHPLGNTTMMDFGTALYKKDPVFNFPYADNIQESRVSKL